jgi:hypothetical protein
MTARIAQSLCAALVATLGALAPSSAQAAIFFISGFSSDGHPVSATASFLRNPGDQTLAVTLTNTTATTHDAGELLTAIDFNLGGLTPTLASASGIQRTVVGSGAFSDTGSPQPLSWSVASAGGGSYSLNFNPNAKDAVLGPPMSGSYSGANASIKGNNGHNPFAAQVAEFLLNVPGIQANTPISVSVFRFGTSLAAAAGDITHMPEPSTAALVGLAATVLGCRRRRAAAR